jgi:hypothetical protein
VTGPHLGSGDLAARDELASLKALVALGLLMAESDDENEILALAATAAPSLGRCVIAGVHLIASGWRHARGPVAPSQQRALVATQLAELDVTDGVIHGVDAGWAWAFPLASRDGPLGHLVVTSDRTPTVEVRYLLSTLAQKIGAALANARSRTRERQTAARLERANADLTASVTSLERSTMIHERFTLVEVRGEGEHGIATTLHELTGLPVGIEDEHGNLRAWAGPGPPAPPADLAPERRQRTLRRALREARPIRDGDRLITVTRSLNDRLGVLVLHDPDRTSGEAELTALEHGATVLAVELGRLRGLEETQLRLGLGLLDVLLSGHDEPGAFARAHALGYDLGRPQRVAVVRGGGGASDGDLLQATRRAAAEVGAESLVGVRSGDVTVLTSDGVEWWELHRALAGSLAGDPCRLGIGGVSRLPGDVPRSFAEARFTLDVMRAVRGEAAVNEFDGLGLFRVLTHVDDVSRMERLVSDLLGPLLAYDDRRGSQLVLTLSTFLDNGGAYDPTCELLSIHRSTLKYRLGRIRELAQVDLSDPRTTFDLHVATRVWRTLVTRTVDR